MKIMLDTSVIVAGMIEPHAFHHIAFPWLKRAKSKEFDLYVVSHTLAELYAVLTTLPVRPRISPGIARQLIQNNIESVGKIKHLSPYASHP